MTLDDVRWLLALTAPRVHALNAPYYRKLEIDDALHARTQALFAGALRDGAYRTRWELAASLAEGGIAAAGQRLAYIVLRAELDGLICSGPARGMRQTYALLAERAPHARLLPREEALAELARRFFAGHGPATLKDLATWSGLTVADAERRLAMAGAGIEHAVVEGRIYLFAAGLPPPAPTAGVAYLIPEFDECLLTYKSLTFPDLTWTRDPATWPDAFSRPIVVDGQRAGTWRRTVGKDRVTLEAALFATLDAGQARALEAAAARYAAFMERPVDLVFV